MSESKSMNDLRKYLFDAMDGLSDKNKPLEIERAKAISDMAQTIINSAKVEVDYAKATGSKVSGFLGERPTGITESYVHKQ